MNKHRLALIVIGVFAIGIVLGGWFLGVQPQLERMATADVQTAAARDRNNVQEIKNAALAADFAKLDEFTSELKKAQATIPAARAQQELIDQIDAAAEASRVDVSSLQLGAAEAHTPPAVVPVTLPATNRLLAVPLKVVVDGDRGQLEAFVANLQKSKRIITITGSSYSGGDDSSLTVTGTTWVLAPTR